LYIIDTCTFKTDSFFYLFLFLYARSSYSGELVERLPHTAPRADRTTAHAHPTCTKRSLHVILRPVVVIKVAIARHEREEPQLKSTV
jgi:hypothetical protein